MEASASLRLSISPLPSNKAVTLFMAFTLPLQLPLVFHVEMLLFLYATATKKLVFPASLSSCFPCL